MDYEQIAALVREVSKAGLSYFEYSEGNIHISMGCKSQENYSAEVQTAGIPAQEEEATSKTTDSPEEIPVHSNIQVVTSPLVGTFYRAPSENAESFVKVGDRVEKGQTLAIVEAMKLMNEIESDYAGVVTEILAENESPVEYGQPLFKIAQ